MASCNSAPTAAYELPTHQGTDQAPKPHTRGPNTNIGTTLKRTTRATVAAAGSL
jgi:hypothetical protein